MAIMIDNQTGPVTTDIFYEGGDVMVSVKATNWNSSSMTIQWTDELGVTAFLPVGFGGFSSDGRTQVQLPPGTYHFVNNAVIGLSVAFVRVPQ